MREISVKTQTKTTNGNRNFSILCFSDMNEDGTTVPVLFNSEVLNSSKTIDNVRGKEGELILSYVGDRVGDINESGELIIDIENDDVNKYNKENQDLTYER